MKKVYSKGFTLIELMVTMSIITMLVAVALPTLKHYKEKSMVAQLIHESGRVASGLETYYNYSGNFTDLTLDSPDGGPIMGAGAFTGAVVPRIPNVTWELQPFGSFICIRACREASFLGIVRWRHCVSFYSSIIIHPLTGIETGFERVIDTGPDNRYGFNVGTPPAGGLPPDLLTP